MGQNKPLPAPLSHRPKGAAASTIIPFFRGNQGQGFVLCSPGELGLQ